MRRPTRGRVAAGGVALVALVAGGAGAVLATVPAPRPDLLQPARPPAVVGVTERQDSDARRVQVEVVGGAPRFVFAPHEGTLTSSTCVVGDHLASGEVVATLDGQPVVALATALPLWRDLLQGDRGDDVRALQEELVRLGVPVARDGVLGPATVRAVRTWSASRGVDLTQRAPGGASVVLPEGTFAWLPGRDVPIQACSVPTGGRVEAGAALFSLGDEVVSARLVSLPVSPVAGARVLRLGGEDVPVDEDGIVRDESALARLGALAAVAGIDTAGGASGSVDADGSGARTIPAEWSLVEPVTVQVLPPSALFGVSGGQACVALPRRSGDDDDGDGDGDGDDIVEVEIVGSDLGSSSVRTLDGSALGRVRIEPPSGAACP